MVARMSCPSGSMPSWRAWSMARGSGRSAFAGHVTTSRFLFRPRAGGRATCDLPGMSALDTLHDATQATFDGRKSEFRRAPPLTRRPEGRGVDPVKADVLDLTVRHRFVSLDEYGDCLAPDLEVAELVSGFASCASRPGQGGSSPATALGGPLSAKVRGQFQRLPHGASQNVSTCST